MLARVFDKTVKLVSQSGTLLVATNAYFEFTVPPDVSETRNLSGCVGSWPITVLLL